MMLTAQERQDILRRLVEIATHPEVQPSVFVQAAEALAAFDASAHLDGIELSLDQIDRTLAGLSENVGINLDLVVAALEKVERAIYNQT